MNTMSRLSNWLRREWPNLMLATVLVVLLGNTLVAAMGPRDLLMLRERRSELEDKRADLISQKAELETSVQNLRSNDRYIEHLIRRELGYARPDELVYKFTGPTNIYEFDPKTWTFTDTQAPVSGGSFVDRMVDLPTGQVLVGFCNSFTGAGRAQTYTSSGSPNSAWAPTISSVPATLVTSATYQLAGTQLNGLTEAAYFGDDARNASNYPLVRITNNATSHVFYARTFGHSTMSVAPNTASSTNFTLPASGKIETGASSLVVVANGIASQPAAVTVVSGSNYTLSVSVIGSPGGRVTSSPAGIDCGSTCSTSFTAGSQVTLTTSPAVAWGLAGWGGACSGIGSCSVTLNANTSVSASFTTLFTAAQAPLAASPADIPVLLPSLLSPLPQPPTAY